MPRFEWPVLRKPILGSQIDPTHPLASGLVSYIPLWEGGGPATRDIVSGSNLVTASATPWSSGLTSGLLCTTDGTGVQGNLPASLQIQPPLTMAIGFRLVSTPVVSCPALGIYVGGTSTRTLALETGSTLTINFVTATGTLLAKSLSLGTDYVAVVTAVSGNSSLYVNAVLAQNSASTYTVSYSSPTIQIGGVSFAGGVRNPGSLIYWTAIWNRFLAPVEIKQVSANPWQIFHPPPATLSIWYPSGGAPPVTYDFSGPSSVYVGNATTAYTISSSSSEADTITLSDGVAGGTFSPTSLSWPGQTTFEYTPVTTGSITITPTSGLGGSFTPSSLTLTSNAITYTFSGPATGGVNTNSAPFTIQPIAFTIDTISLSDGSQGGTFYPSSLAINSGNPFTFVYNPTQIELITLTPTSNAGDTITPSSLAYNSTNSVPGGGGEFIWQTYMSSTTAAAYRRRRRMQG